MSAQMEHGFIQSAQDDGEENEVSPKVTHAACSRIDKDGQLLRQGLVVSDSSVSRVNLSSLYNLYCEQISMSLFYFLLNASKCNHLDTQRHMHKR